MFKSKRIKRLEKRVAELEKKEVIVTMNREQIAKFVNHQIATHEELKAQAKQREGGFKG